MSRNESHTFVVQWSNLDGGISEGPIQVLWSLIDSYKVDIFDVSLSRITRDYIQFLKTSESLSLELTSEFALMASHLVYWKSKALLPDPGFEEDEFDPPLPQELVEKLLEHKKFQIAGQKLGELDRIASGIFSRDTNQVIDEGDSWLDVSLVALISAFHSYLEKAALTEENSKIFDPVEHYSIEEKMDLLLSILEKRGEILFQELFSKKPSRREIVAVFLAVLETVKIKKTQVLQRETFGELKIVKRA